MRSFQNINFYKDLYLDLFLPEKDEFYTIIHFHGGGLVEGDKGDTYKFVEHLVNLGFAVATANYSLLPKVKYQEILNDAGEAVRFINENISKYGKSKGLFISGQSAGAWITLMLCFNKSILESKNIKNEQVLGWISDSAQPTSHFNILKIEQGLDPLTQRIDECAPLFYVNENTTFSKILLMSYEDDLANRLEQNKLLYSSLKSFNKDADIEFKLLKKWHCHGSCELDDDGEFEVIKSIKDWLNI